MSSTVNALELQVQAPSSVQAVEVETRANSSLKSRIQFGLGMQGGVSVGFGQSDQHDALKAQFADTLKSVLTREGFGDIVDKLEDFQINFTRKTVHFTHPESHEKYAFDLIPIGKQDLAIEQFLKEVDALYESHTARAPALQDHAKGVVSGSSAQGRTPLIDKAFPNTFDICSKTFIPYALANSPKYQTEEAKTKAMNGLLFAESLVQELQKGVETRYEQQKKEYDDLMKSSSPDVEKRKIAAPLKQGLSQLQALKEDLNKWDASAFALAFLYSNHEKEVVSLSQIDAVAEDLEKVMKARLDSVASKESKKGAKLTQENQYIQDVTGMLYLSRAEAAHFCEERGTTLKKERLEETILRATLEATRTGEYKGAADRLLKSLHVGKNDSVKDALANAIRPAVEKQESNPPLIAAGIEEPQTTEQVSKRLAEARKLLKPAEEEAKPEQQQLAI